MTQELLYDKRDQVGWVTFNRPQARNALTFAMYEGVAEVCARVAKTGEVRALVVTGAGDKAFAAGTDIAQFRDFKSGEDGIAYERKMDRILETIERCPVPTIAAVNGFCTGGGAAIAAVCDFRIASASAQFGFVGLSAKIPIVGVRITLEGAYNTGGASTLGTKIGVAF